MSLTEYELLSEWEIRQQLGDLEDEHNQWIRAGKHAPSTIEGTRKINQQYGSRKERLNRQLEELRAKKAEAQLEPYSVLELKSTASGKQIYQAFIERNLTFSVGQVTWSNGLEQARMGIVPDPKRKSWYFQYNLSNLLNCEDMSDRVAAAYAALSKVKPYNPHSWFRKLFPFLS